MCGACVGEQVLAHTPPACLPIWRSSGYRKRVLAAGETVKVVACFGNAGRNGDVSSKKRSWLAAAELFIMRRLGGFQIMLSNGQSIVSFRLGREIHGRKGQNASSDTASSTLSREDVCISIAMCQHEFRYRFLQAITIFPV